MIEVIQAASTRRLIAPGALVSALGVSTPEAEALANAVTSMIERYCNRTFAVETVRERIAPRGTAALRLARFPLVEITDDEEIPSDYYADKSKGWLYRQDGGAWPDSGLTYQSITPVSYARANPPLRFAVEYVAGYEVPEQSDTGAEPLPAELTQAALMVATSLHKSACRDTGLASESIGDWSWTAGTGGAMTMVAHFLDPYRVIA